MGLVYADVELINAVDLENSKHNIIDKEDIRRMFSNMLVDTGAYYLCINEDMNEILGLSVLEKRKAQLANGQVEEYDVVGPIELKFQNRRCHVDAMLLKGNSEPLLGAIPMEDLDVLVHPLKQELVVNPEHPDMVQMKLK